MIEVLERCTFAFKDDERYKDDHRYLRLWIAYADLVDRDAVEDIFNYLYGRQTGVMHALFWESWAATLEAKRKFEPADKCYTKGILMRAQPAGRLERAHNLFQNRMMKRIMSGDAAGPGEEAQGGGAAAREKERKTLNRLTKKEAAGSKRPTNQRAAAPLKKAAAPLGGTGKGGGGGAEGQQLPNLRGENLQAGEGFAEDENGEPSAFEMGTATENVKENTGAVTSWNEPLERRQADRRRGRATGQAAPGGGQVGGGGKPFHIPYDEGLGGDDVGEGGGEEGGGAAAERVPIRLQLAGSHTGASAEIARLRQNPLARFTGNRPVAAADFDAVGASPSTGDQVAASSASSAAIAATSSSAARCAVGIMSGGVATPPQPRR